MEKRIWEVADSVHAAHDAAVGHQPLALFTGVLAALIRVVQLLVRLADGSYL
jgi:hypothetical protein